EDALEADPALDPGQRATRTGVDAATKRDVVEGVLPVDLEVVGALEAPGVAVGGPVEEHDRRPGLDLDVADRRCALGEPEVRLHRALDAQRLLDEVRDAVLVLAQLVLKLR